MSTGQALQLRVLRESDAPAFRGLRLLALEESPTAFGADPQYERTMALQQMATRIAPDDGEGSAVLGVFDGDALVAVAGLHREPGLKNRHTAFIWSVYVAPGYRRGGVGSLLLRETIAHARTVEGLRRVNLTVNATNAPALDLYRRLGFVEYGRQPESLFVDGVYHDEILMSLALAGS